MKLFIKISLLILCSLSLQNGYAQSTQDTQTTNLKAPTQAQKEAMSAINAAEAALNKKLDIIENNYKKAIFPAQEKMKKQIDQAYKEYENRLNAVKEKFGTKKIAEKI